MISALVEVERNLRNAVVNNPGSVGSEAENRGVGTDKGQRQQRK